MAASPLAHINELLNVVGVAVIFINLKLLVGLLVGLFLGATFLPSLAFGARHPRLARGRPLFELVGTCPGVKAAKSGRPRMYVIQHVRLLLEFLVLLNASVILAMEHSMKLIF